jgi:hypothetical protein
MRTAIWQNNSLWKTSPVWKKLSTETKQQILGNFKDKKNFTKNFEKNEKGGEE